MPGLRCFNQESPGDLWAEDQTTHGCIDDKSPATFVYINAAVSELLSGNQQMVFKSSLECSPNVEKKWES